MIRQVERAAENVVIHQHDFLVIPLEELGRSSVSPMDHELATGVVSDGYPTGTLNLANLFLVSIEAQIIDDQENLHSTLGSIL
jgi:hypothetical protein